MNRVQLIIFGFIGVVVLVAVLMLTGVLPGLRESPPPPFTLTIWGTDDEDIFWKDIASTYQEEVVRSATIIYQQKSVTKYETDLVNALASGTGPDIFFLSDSWIEKHLDKVTPLPEGSLEYRRRDLKSIFADRLADAITTTKGELIGVPMAIDTLGLFFNRDYLNAATIPNPPQTWPELVDDVTKITIFNDVRGIKRSGIALGTASNIDHAPDIYLALLAQSGGTVLDPLTKRNAFGGDKAESALAFYTAFADSTKKTYSWNALFPKSLEAFARGNTAMALGYASDVRRIVAINPQLNFDATELPQTATDQLKVNFGRFSLLSVSKATQQARNAWNFLLWLEGKDVQKQYADAFGLPPARRDLVTSTPPKDYLTPFYDQVLSAHTIPTTIGDSLPEILHEMIDSVINKRFNIHGAVDRATSQIEILLPD